MQANTDLYQQLDPICKAVTFARVNRHEPQIHFANELVVGKLQDTYSTVLERQQEDPLTLALRNTIYQRCYAYPFTGADSSPAEHTDDRQIDHTAQLSAANTGKAQWESLWTIEAITSEGRYIAVRDSEREQLWPGEFISTNGTGQPPTAGSQILVYRPSEASHWQPGFYHAFGQTHNAHFDQDNLVRFYWNVRVAEAAPLVSAVTTEFNRYQIPFRFKCTNLSSLSGRVDTAVLYLSVEHFRLGLHLVMDIHADIRATLDSDVPLFSYRLAPGLSFAQNPAGDSSFGMERCLRLARAIRRCARSSSSYTQPLTDHVLQQLQTEGLDLQKPHLMSDTYDHFTKHLESIRYEH